VWSPKGTTLRVIRCPTLQVSQFLFPGQRSDTFLTDHVYILTVRKFLQLLRSTFGIGRSAVHTEISAMINAKVITHVENSHYQRI
jgi:hypothetical protein